MENDLISRSALLNHLSKKKAEQTTKDDMGAGAHLIVAILDLLAELVSLWPAVDAVEVVRCKDCTFYNFGECGNYRMDMSDGAHFYPYPNDFCSYGERRADDGK